MVVILSLTHHISDAVIYVFMLRSVRRLLSKKLSKWCWCWCWKLFDAGGRGCRCSVGDGRAGGCRGRLGVDGRGGVGVAATAAGKAGTSDGVGVVGGVVGGGSDDSASGGKC